jgi:hypothetical protein
LEEEVNRRDFLLGGGVFGLIGAAVAAVRKAAQTPRRAVLCQGEHQPMETYRMKPKQTAALCIGDGQGDGIRAVVPCKHCGVLFGIGPDPQGGGAAMHIQGSLGATGIFQYGEV